MIELLEEHFTPDGSRGPKLAIEEGKHLGGGGLQLLKAKALRLEPTPRTPSAAGLVVVDGEVVPFGPIEARAHARAMRVLVPAP